MKVLVCFKWYVFGVSMMKSWLVIWRQKGTYVVLSKVQTQKSG